MNTQHEDIGKIIVVAVNVNSGGVITQNWVPRLVIGADDSELLTRSFPRDDGTHRAFPRDQIGAMWRWA